MKRDDSKYYNLADWGLCTSESLAGKIQIIKTLIPSDVKSILDIGCGNGAITNVLGENFDVTGVDISSVALEQVTTAKMQASSAEVPLADNFADMVFSSEVLEHLDEETYRATLNEIARLARKYVLISVPFNETVARQHVQCPDCGLIFPRNYHFRSFNRASMKSLLSGFKLQMTECGGMAVRGYHPRLIRLRHKIVPWEFGVPYSWRHWGTKITVCPDCETQFDVSFKTHPFGFVLDAVNTVIKQKQPYWLITLFQKTQ
ncbi:MAG: class I SAM-dependent methyltransferase [Candidatus Cloacimonetes bacterium]|nr:class I SAM-dependent methyltransferase [Candidatus Cloacimonadota bacterium]